MLLLEYILTHCKYSNAPEGQRPFEKVIGLSKYGLLAGFGVGSYDCVLMSQAYTFWEAINCMSYWIVPATAMCATFASVAYTVTKIRGKDGYANYIAATAATSGVFYHWQNSGRPTYPFTVFLLLGAMIKKHGDMIGWNPFPIIFKPEDIRTQHTNLPGWSPFKDSRGPRPWE